MDCIYLDFKKAFDSVPHERLLSKLDAYGIGGPLKAWTKYFLLDRKQRVVVNGKLSSWSLVLSGIPLGSVLGPILFVIFINEADDYSCLQNDLDRLVEWSHLWQLHFNDSKCKVLHMENSNPSHCYTMSNIPLTKTAEEKDLGVIMDNELKFYKHTAYAVKRASKMLGLFRAIFTCLDEITVPKIVMAMVRLHLEYGNVIWHPRYQLDKTEIEKVQRRAIKLISTLRHEPYEARLRSLKLPSLDYQRRRGDMLQVFRILNGLDRLDPQIFFKLSKQIRTRGHCQKLYNDHSRLELRKHVFSQMIINDWNSLPELVITCKSVNIFKSRLDPFWYEEQYKAP